MFKSYDELRNHIKNVYGEDHMIMGYIETAFELGSLEGEVAGFKEAVKEEFSNIDYEDLPDDLIREIEEESYNRGCDDTYQSAYDEGHDSGHDAGYNEGRKDGYDEGHDAGYESGYDDGYNAGYDECKDELGVE